ncbi:hypothetical protein [Gorillibacterium timonense]|uniref:hypothetical protein n=1 Tax=Gorillibacterium timonense TaxID=1689269 RepID=UPI00071E4716|nr:hypothetical protein [Gorillibacterium timonense]
MTDQRKTKSNVIYQANPDVMKAVRTMQDQLAEIGQKHLNKPVRVQTVKGEVYDGIIAHVDETHLYLNAVQPLKMDRAYYPPFGPNPNVILPLALYNLLVLTLLI